MRRRPCWHALIASLLFLSSVDASHAHGLQNYGTNPRGIEHLDWQAEHISRTLTAGYPDSFGLFAFFDREPPSAVEIEGRKCLRANFIALDVDAAFAFDIDSSVSLALTLAVDARQTLLLAFDGNAGSGAPSEQLITPAEDGSLQRLNLQLDRARFADRGMAGTDIALTTAATMNPAISDESAVLTLCGLSISRGDVAQEAQASGNLVLDIKDAASGEPMAARFGLYDASGRAVAASSDALLVHHYEHEVRDTPLRDWEPWPMESRWVFYADGRYAQSLPAGTYTLVASRGPEFKRLHKTLEIKAGETLTTTVSLARWADQPAGGWYSGDIHVHLPRRAKDNARVAAFMAAEDLHASSILQAGNPAGYHFEQYAFGREGSHARGSHALIPGIESPRTAVRGHTISLDIDQPYAGSGDYFLYDYALQHYRKQGASTGYAHVGSEEFYASRGLALDVPFGLVDFVEIMQAGQLRTELWYRYLNLGYQLAPAAGSDFPYFEHPGGVRSYVKIDQAWSPSAWIDGLRAGHTFVTNGPLLQFSVNGAQMGSVLDLSAGGTLKIEGEARMNPDLGALESITLVHCGEPVASAEVAQDASGALTLKAALPAGRSGWLALRAEGSGRLSHSAPVYLRPGGEPGGCTDKVDDALVEVYRALDALESHTVEVQRELEYWQLEGLEQAYLKQRPAILARIQKARDAYQQLR
ncbi:MAG: CehA/McbA family metallohydrolase [Pseudomonadota bacterium]